MEFKEPQAVKITSGRWDVIVQVIDSEGNLNTFIVSADSGVAESGIFFGTKEEYENALVNQW